MMLMQCISKCGWHFWIRTGAAVLVGTGCLIGVFAQDGPSNQNQNEAANLFRNLDTNRDGKLTFDEAGPGTRPLMENVYNMSGKARTESLSREDFQKIFDEFKSRSRNGGGGGNQGSPMPRSGSPDGGPPQGGGPGPGGFSPDGLPPILAQLDENGDGRITRSELQRLAQVFDRLDANRDGALTMDEIRAAGNQSRPGGNGRPPGNPPPGGARGGQDFPPNKNGGPAPMGPGNRSGGAGGRPPTDDRGDDEPAPKPADKPASKSSTKPADKAAPKSSTKSSSKTASRADSERGIPTGVWRGWIVNGRGENPNSGQMEIELTVEGNHITGREVGTRRAPEGIGGGNFTITGDGKSGNLDAEGTSGPQDGRSFLGIYEFDGETLRWCVSNRGRQRPQSMATDRGNYLLVLRQQK